MNEGVWHRAHPTLLNTCRPFAIDEAPPGEFGEGVGGARRRMKFVKFWIAVVAWSGVVASMFWVSFGTVANWHAGFSSRSVWKMSFVMPISTLYASPENSSPDLFWAFQPNLAMVPSLPLLLVWPEIVRPLT
jgi:hypothetical protein